MYHKVPEYINCSWKDWFLQNLTNIQQMQKSVFFSHTRMTPFSGTPVIYSYFIYISCLHKNLWMHFRMRTSKTCSQYQSRMPLAVILTTPSLPQTLIWIKTQLRYRSISSCLLRTLSINRTNSGRCTVKRHCLMYVGVLQWKERHAVHIRLVFLNPFLH
jgi:hypothetical protein